MLDGILSRMITNRYLPSWLHRVACGTLAGVLVVSIGSECLRHAVPASWLYAASGVVVWLSIPIGLTAAYMAHRCSIVEGCAGDLGYEDLSPEHEGSHRSNKPT